MSKIKNINMRQFNGVDYDYLYPYTSISQVKDGLSKDEASGLYLPTTGGTMSGILDMDGNRISGVGTPTADNDAVNKSYVDSVSAFSLKKIGTLTKVDTNLSFSSEDLMLSKGLFINLSVGEMSRTAAYQMDLTLRTQLNTNSLLGLITYSSKKTNDTVKNINASMFLTKVNSTCYDNPANSTGYQFGTDLYLTAAPGATGALYLTANGTVKNMKVDFYWVM